jgi:predicted chitinase
MKLTCDEATTICDKTQYGEATLWEKIKLNFHLFMCKNCRLYSKQNKIITKCINGHEHGINETCNCLNEEEKHAIEKELEIHS